MYISFSTSTVNRIIDVFHAIGQLLLIFDVLLQIKIYNSDNEFMFQKFMHIDDKAFV